jgi:hypothetical protein
MSKVEKSACPFKCKFEKESEFFVTLKAQQKGAWHLDEPAAHN